MARGENQCEICGDFVPTGDDNEATFKYEDRDKKWYFCTAEHRLVWTLKGGAQDGDAAEREGEPAEGEEE